MGGTDDRCVVVESVDQAKACLLWFNLDNLFCSSYPLFKNNLSDIMFSPKPILLMQNKRAANGSYSTA